MSNKLGLMYACNSCYIIPLIVSLSSVLENNCNAIPERRLELSIIILTDNWSESDKKKVFDICNKYGQIPTFIDGTIFNEEIMQMGFNTYGGSYSAFYQMLFANYFDYEFHILYLECDVIMLPDNDLYELANWSFYKDGREFAYACNTDPENSTFMRKSNHLDNIRYHICNVGVILISTKNYRKLGCYNHFKSTIIDVGNFSYNDDFMYFNYAFRDNIMILPLKYQIYPGYSKINYNELIFIFNIDKPSYYTENEYNNAVSKPVFIHFVNFISKKPWQNDIDSSFTPYKNLWEKYCYEIATINYFNMPSSKITLIEKIKRFLFKNLRFVWLIICRIGNTLKWKLRLRTIKNYNFYNFN